MDAVTLLNELIESKLKELRSYQAKITELEEAIRAYRLTARDLRQKSAQPEVAEKKPSKKEESRNREEKVIDMLTKAGTELHAKQLAEQFSIHFETMKDWMLKRIEKYGTGCAWEQGRNSYHFKLRTGTQAPAATPQLAMVG
jgi:regulator of replication initiation timing